MHCICCDRLLSDYEATRRDVNTNQFLDMCNKCYGTISNEVLTLDRQDLKHDDEDELNDYDISPYEIDTRRIDNEQN